MDDLFDDLPDLLDPLTTDKPSSDVPDSTPTGPE